MLLSAIQEVYDLVGEKVALKAAREVFENTDEVSLSDVDDAFNHIQRSRGVVSGLIGAAKAAITGGGQMGGAAITTAANMVKSIAKGSDGKSGLAGENGVAATMTNTASDVASTVLGTV